MVQDRALVQVPQREQPHERQVHGGHPLGGVVPPEDVPGLQRLAPRLRPHEAGGGLLRRLRVVRGRWAAVVPLQPGLRGVARHCHHLLHAPLHYQHAGHRRLLLELRGRPLVPRALRRPPHGPRLGRRAQDAPGPRGLAAAARGLRGLRPLRAEPRALRRGPPPRRWQLLAGCAAGAQGRCSQARAAQGPRRPAAEPAGLGGRVVRLPRALGLPLELEPAQQDAVAPRCRHPCGARPAGFRHHALRAAFRCPHRPRAL
mmetsp:Transcript_45597/g.145489  ORF Transcript_45597/g.145489 Transcript_45597/m.145489 type:complete len:258 (+) Transcript_45597:796-1569(+)